MGSGSVSRVVVRLGGLALVIMAALVGLAAARASAPQPRPVTTFTRARLGLYARVYGVNSANVRLHVRAGQKIPALMLLCRPASAGVSSVTIDIEVHAPALSITKGSFAYSGPARVTGAISNGPTLAETTLTVRATHVDGPVHAYTLHGAHLHATTAWRGTAVSPACKTIDAGGQFTLFGPLSGQ